MTNRDTNKRNPNETATSRATSEAAAINQPMFVTSESYTEQSSNKGFENTWHYAVVPQMHDIEERAGKKVFLEPEEVLKERVHKAYQAFRRYCKTHCMTYPNRPMDRHKVAACFMLAIEVAQLAPQVYTDTDESVRYTNERLATTVGCSILISFILEVMDYISDHAWGLKHRMSLHIEQSVPKDTPNGNGSYTGDVQNSALVNDIATTDFWDEQRHLIEQNQIQFPEAAHGGYERTIYQSLYQMKSEGYYAILLLANLLYCWEAMSVDSRVEERLREFYEQLGNTL